MRLLEFQGKRLLSEYGIPTPQGKLVSALDELAALEYPAVIKAQIPAGSRGKAGGIRRVHRTTEALKAGEALLGTTILGYPVQALLVEKWVPVQRELFLSLMIDNRTGSLLLIASAEGGVDIEQVAHELPQALIAKHLDPLIGIPEYLVRFLSRFLDLQEPAGLRHVLERMVAMQQDLETTMIEINPLGETAKGLIAMDAKIVMDDMASFRHADLHDRLKAELGTWVRLERTPAEEIAAERGITYVPLPGDIGLISDGAGTGMLTLDLIQDLGGQPANFCEMGGLSNAETMRQAMEIVLSDAKVKVLLVSLIGGLTRMDHMGDGIATYQRQTGSSIPVVVRMCGTQEEAGKQTLQDVGIEAFDGLTESVGRAVALAREG